MKIKLNSIFINNIITDFQKYLIFIIVMLYITCKIIHNSLIFKQLNISFIEPFNIIDTKISSYVLMFFIICTLSNLISTITNRKLAIYIIITGIICEGVFSLLIHSVTTLPIPNHMTTAQQLYTRSINDIGAQIWDLFYYGVTAKLISNISEIIVFNYLTKKINSFVLSSIISVSIILLVQYTLHFEL